MTILRVSFFSSQQMWYTLHWKWPPPSTPGGGGFKPSCIPLQLRMGPPTRRGLCRGFCPAAAWCQNWRRSGCIAGRTLAWSSAILRIAVEPGPGRDQISKRYITHLQSIVGIIGVWDEFRSGVGGGGGAEVFCPNIFFHCLHVNQVVLSEYYLIPPPPENGLFEKFKGAAPPPLAPWAVRLGWVLTRTKAC